MLAVVAMTVVGSAVAAERCESPPVLRFAVVPADESARSQQLFRPLAERIEKATGRPLKILVPGSYSSVVEDIVGGAVDVAWLGPASYVEARKGDARIAPFATIEKKPGVYQSSGPYYRSVLAVLGSSSFKDLRDLKGRTVALTDPLSTSGSLLPRKQLTPRLKLSFEQYFGAITFTGSHDKSLRALAQGQVDAAFVASTQLESALLSGQLSADRVRVLWTSEPIPYDPFVYRGQLCEPLRRQIRSAFFGDGAEADLRGILDAFKAERFIPVDENHYLGIEKALGS